MAEWDAQLFAQQIMDCIRENDAQLITEATRTDILDSAITELFSNPYGYMMGQGSVWFSSFPQEGLKIYAINSMAE